MGLANKCQTPCWRFSVLTTNITNWGDSLIQTQLCLSILLVIEEQNELLVVPVAVSANREQGNPFSEMTTTLIVNATGALVYLTTAVSEGQKFKMINSITGQGILCTVANVTKSGQEKEKREIGIAFAEEKPRFWGISFPPDDWASANRKYPPEPSIGPN